jgi:hypothetical protein
VPPCDADLASKASADEQAGHSVGHPRPYSQSMAARGLAVDAERWTSVTALPC